MRKYFIALDIGGTKTSVAVFDTQGNILNDLVEVIPTPTYEGEEAIYRSALNAATHLLSKLKIKKTEIKGIGIASPGPLDTRKGVIIHAPLMGWRNFPIVERMKSEFDVPIILDNDCNLGALAEQRMGIAKGMENVIYITMSTGIGGGFVLGGNIYHGRHDGAGEVGHMIVEPEGILCPCGSRGCLELYASGTAIARTAASDMANGTSSKIRDITDGDNSKITASVVATAARNGDAYAKGLFERAGYYVGIALSNLANLLDPDRIVIGGGLSKASDLFRGPLLNVLGTRNIQKTNPEELIWFSELCDRVVLYGAYCIIRENTCL